MRSFGRHRDRAIGVDLVFAEQDPRGVFSATYDPATPGRIHWSVTPELDLSTVSAAGISGSKRLSADPQLRRVQRPALRRCGPACLRAVDGKDPHWRRLYTNPYPGRISETGLRGLTAISAPTGSGEVLLVAVEGTAPRIVRVDPRDGSEATELDVADLLRQRWGLPASYVIAGYNDMAKVRDPAGGEALLIGIEAYIPAQAPVAAGHRVVGVGYGRLEGGGWYLGRRVNGHYERQVPAPPESSLVAVRAIRASPFTQQPGWVYFAGYDANKSAAHHTAWIIRGPRAGAISHMTGEK